MFHVKMKDKTGDFWCMIAAMASVALCAVIDVLLKDSSDECPENQTEENCDDERKETCDFI